MSKSRNIDRAQFISNGIEKERISSTPNVGNFNRDLNFTRKWTNFFSQQAGCSAPALTACVATTFIGYALCQELAQRFALEYVREYKEQDVSLVVLGNPDTFGSGGDAGHTFDFVGSISVSDDLIIGKGGTDVIARPQEHNVKIEEFFAKNKGGAIADLLLKFTGSANESKTFIERCQEKKWTHVIGVRSYLNTPGFSLLADTIRENAIEIANQVRTMMPGILPQASLLRSKPREEKSKTPETLEEFQQKLIEDLKQCVLKNSDKFLTSAEKQFQSEMENAIKNHLSPNDIGKIVSSYKDKLSPECEVSVRKILKDLLNGFREKQLEFSQLKYKT